MARGVRQVTICGFGLIGGSIALDFLRGAGKRFRLVAYDRRRVLETVKRDQRFKVICESHLAEAVQDADLIILSATHAANEKLLARLADISNLRDCLIVDTGAVKSHIIELASGLHFGEGTQFLPSHPMSGKEKKGSANSEPNVFKDHAWFFDDGVELTASNQSRLDWLVNRTGGFPVYISGATHDQLVSEISHLPQLISTVLGAQINSDMIPLAGPGLRSMLRLTGSPYDVWSEIINENRDEIAKSLQVYIDNMQRVIDRIENKESLGDIFAAATRSYKCLS